MKLERIDRLFNFEKGSLQSSKCNSGKFTFITAAADWKTHDSYTHDCEALIFAAAASGSLGRTHYTNGKFISSDLCFIITPKDPNLYPIDLKFYHILFNELKEDIVRNTKAGTSKEAIGLGSFGKYELPYIPIDTQLIIKEKFIRLQNLKTNLATHLTNQLLILKNLRQQLYQDAIEGKLVKQIASDETAQHLINKINADRTGSSKIGSQPSNLINSQIEIEDIPFEIPSSWKWCKLKAIADGFQYGSSTKSSKSGKVPVLRMGNIQNGVIDWSDLVYTDNADEISQYNLTAGDLLFNRTNSRELVGKTALYDGLKTSIFAGYLIRFSTVFGISPEYANIVMNSALHREWCNSNKTDALGQSNINATKLREFPFPLPPIAEQNRIAAKVAELMRLCNQLESNIKDNILKNENLLQQVLRELLELAAPVSKSNHYIKESLNI